MNGGEIFGIMKEEKEEKDKEKHKGGCQGSVCS